MNSGLFKNLIVYHKFWSLALNNINIMHFYYVLWLTPSNKKKKKKKEKEDPWLSTQQKSKQMTLVSQKRMILINKEDTIIGCGWKYKSGCSHDQITLFMEDLIMWQPVLYLQTHLKMVSYLLYLLYFHLRPNNLFETSDTAFHTRLPWWCFTFKMVTWKKK